MVTVARARIVAALVAVAACGVLAGCVGEPGTAPASSASTPAPTASLTPGATLTPEPTPLRTPTATVPDDCRAILDDTVLSALGDTPLNDPAFAPTGVQPDGSLICVWRHPGADTTGLVTTISSMSRGPALDMLNELADDEGFTCYTPDGGTRCEKTWQNADYPVIDGRTLFWRDDILIDTAYSNLAPPGYTSAIIAAVFE